MADKDINEPVTKGVLSDAVDTILKGMDNIAKEITTEFHNELIPLKQDVETLKKDMSSVKSEITFIKRDIQDLKADLSDTPSRREFNELKTKVEKHLRYHNN